MGGATTEGKLEEIGKAKLTPDDELTDTPFTNVSSETTDILRAIQIVNLRQTPVFESQKSIIDRLNQAHNDLETIAKQLSLTQTTISGLLSELIDTQSKLQNIHVVLEALTSQNQSATAAKNVIQKYEEGRTNSINSIINNWDD